MSINTIFDTPGNPNCLQCESDGSTVVMCRESILSYSSPVASVLETRWITLSRKPVTPVVASSGQSSMFDWYHDFNGNCGEVRLLCFQQFSTCPNSLFNNEANLLVTVLTNGSLLIFRQVSLGSIVYDSNPYFQLKMCGYELVYDFSNTFSKWCIGQQYSHIISYFSLKPDLPSSTIALVIATASNVSVWRISLSANTLQSDFLVQYSLSPNISSSQLHPSTSIRVTSLIVVPTRNGGSTSSFSIWIGDHQGSLHTFMCDQQTHSIVSSGSKSLSSSAINWFKEDVDNSNMFVISGNKVFIVRVEDYTIVATQKFRYPVSGLIAMKDNLSDANQNILLGTIDGTYHAWNLISSSVTTSRNLSSVCTVNTPVSGGSGLFGLQCDSLGLIVASAAKINPVHDNSRENQLFLHAGKPKTELMWELSPWIDKNILDSSESIATLLAKVLSYYYEHALLSVSSIALVFLLSYQHLHQANGSKSSISLKSESVNNDSDSEEESDNENEPQRKKNKSSLKAKKFEASDSSTNIETIVKSITGNGDQFKATLIEESLQNIVTACISLIGKLKIKHEIRYSHSLEDEEGLYYLPSESSELLKKVPIWQVLHLTILVMHAKAQININQHWMNILTNLRKLIMVAKCIIDVESFSNHDANIKSLSNKAHILKAFFRGFSSSAIEELLSIGLPSNQNEAEQCFLCNTPVVFDGNSFEMMACGGCGVQSERCCNSYLILQTSNVIRCPCCQAVVNATASSSLLCPYCNISMYKFL